MTAATSHNGGRYQIGLNFLQIGNDFPFLNCMKTAQSWAYLDNTNAPTPDELDANGYAKAGSSAVTSHGGVYTVFYVPTQAERPGRYKITWTGNGTIHTGMATTSTVGSKTGSGGSGSFEFSTTDYRFVVGHTTGGDVSDMKVFHVDDEAAILAGEVFGTKFKARIAESLCGVIRFMDWQPGNTTNVTTWATRKPIGYVFYSGSEYRESMWAGATTNVGDAYTASSTPSGWAGLVDKATVIVKFNASASGDSSTLNVAGTGAIAIKNWYGDATTSGSNTRPLANTIGTLTYDATLNAWMKHGGDTTGRQGLNNGVPMELMVQLAAETGCHPYFTTPYLAIDPATDYMTSLATYIRDNGPSWMIPRFEGTNETWNSGFGFFATRYGWNKANSYWGATQDHHNWYGKIASVLGQAISAVYSDNRARYQVLAGVQTSTGDSVSVSNPRLTAALYVAQGAAAQTGYVKSAAYNWVTHVCCAQYITPPRYGTLQELRDGFAYTVTYAADPTSQATLAMSYADTLLGASANYNLALVATWYANWYGWAHNNWGGSINLGLTGYEGGYSPDYSAITWSSPITGATAANPCVLTLATTSGTRGSIAGGGNPAVAGMQLSIPMTITGVTKASSAVVTVSGFNMAVNGMSIVISGFDANTGMIQLNGTRTITGVSGQDITLSVDSSAFTTYVSGGTATITANVASVAGNSITTDLNGTGYSYSSGRTASYVNSALYTNTLRYGSKFAGSVAAHTINNLRSFVAAGGEYPAIFIFAAPSTGADRAQAIGTGQVWGMWDPSIWASSPSDAWDGAIVFGERKRRFTVRT